ncbi:MAG: tRNA pseudouridine(55) synthase TruB [Sulfuriflexus sp.]|nr:tRNA pseudouridine(55) synthase TruB [Sulfuriflexus sp.]
MGRRRSSNRGRDINGVLLLDKPLGMTSNKALQEVKSLLFAKKAGHTGTLDPLATGLLAICFGEATKLSTYIVDSEKHYRATAQLGITTETGDREGDIIEEKPVPKFDKAQLESILTQFTGEIMQIPPMYSALKHEGEPLYKLARQGITVERQPRPITIYSITVLETTDTTFTVDVVCSKGTYIRTLLEDIGVELGCGAHAADLRRTALGPFTEQDMVSMETLRDAEQNDREALNNYVKPIENALISLPMVKLSPDAAYYLRQGQAVTVPHAPTSGLVQLLADETTFIGVGHILDDGQVAPKRLLNLSEKTA